MQQLIYLMWYLLENYETDPEVQFLVDHLELVFIPCLNPDGYHFNCTQHPNGGGMWRKNRRNNGNNTCLFMVLAMKCSTTPQMEEVVIGFMENRQPKTRLLSFHTNYDYVQLLVSNDMGQSWIPLESENTSLGTAFQDPGKPLYHGFNNEWVKETVSLSPFLGQSILLKFELLSDMSQKF